MQKQGCSFFLELAYFSVKVFKNFSDKKQNIFFGIIFTLIKVLKIEQIMHQFDSLVGSMNAEFLCS
jgi:hypothetical protein